MSTVGAPGAPSHAPYATGCPSVSSTSPRRPAARMRAAAVSAEARTSAAWAGSAEIDGHAIQAVSSFRYRSRLARMNAIRSSGGSVMLRLLPRPERNGDRAEQGSEQPDDERPRLDRQRPEGGLMHAAGIAQGAVHVRERIDDVERARDDSERAGHLAQSETDERGRPQETADGTRTGPERTRQHLEERVPHHDHAQTEREVRPERRARSGRGRDV